MLNSPPLKLVLLAIGFQDLAPDFDCKFHHLPTYTKSTATHLDKAAQTIIIWPLICYFVLASTPHGTLQCVFLYSCAFLFTCTASLAYNVVLSLRLCQVQVIPWHLEFRGLYNCTSHSKLKLVPPPPQPYSFPSVSTVQNF